MVPELNFIIGALTIYRFRGLTRLCLNPTEVFSKDICISTTPHIFSLLLLENRDIWNFILLIFVDKKTKKKSCRLKKDSGCARFSPVYTTLLTFSGLQQSHPSYQILFDYTTFSTFQFVSKNLIRFHH
ncbi:hypothetical protein BpHYR1_027281 [Brachionus plicatilis]|uniref:Uncharacterized protein n=1 Tax=Brachionus plicatilis TaxID=10195 RepID=A0A3M7RAV9_BRAPC|nr:hypothetical protein BpHYR1_027281 [Brachionus plicatilis]